MLADSVAGELIASEVEIRSGKGDGLRATRSSASTSAAGACSRSAESRGVALGATGTHPWSPWQEQRIIDTPHYRLVEEKLKYVAWRNNTFSNHVHVGVRGADRAVAVCDALRPCCPCCWRRRPTRRWSRAASAACTRRARRSSRACSRAAGSPTTSASWEAYAALRRLPLPDALDRRAHPDLVERAPAPRVRDGRDADHGRAVLRGRVDGAAGARDGLCRAGRARLRRRPARPGAAQPADRGELLARDPPRARRQADRPRRRRGDSRRARRSSGLLEWTADARAELRSTSTSRDLGSLLANGNGAQRQWRRARGRASRWRTSTPRPWPTPAPPTPTAGRGAGGALRRGDADEPRRSRRPRAAGDGHERTSSLSEEELRAQLEEELRRITVRDVLLQTVVSLVNLGGQRLGPRARRRGHARPRPGAARDRGRARPAAAARGAGRRAGAPGPRRALPASAGLRAAGRRRRRPEPGRRGRQRARAAAARRRRARQRPAGAGGLWVPPGSAG